MKPTTLTNLLELLRWLGAGTGIFLAFLIQDDPARRLDVLTLWVVVSIAGLTGIESVFFGKWAAQQSGYEGGSAYQRQSGLFNLALALTTLFVYCVGWNLQAKAALLIVLLLFLFFSGINHAYSAIKEHNKSLKNLLRPFMTLLLLAVVIPFIWAAFLPSKRPSTSSSQKENGSDITVLLENNRRWSDQNIARDPDFFTRLVKGQHPSYFWLGCSDSRVPANEVIGLKAGELFVHRNVANLFVHTDMNSLSVLQYAVEMLKVPHIIVCGHYGCGGVHEAMEHHSVGLIDNWLMNIRDVMSYHQTELENISDHDLRWNRLVELNVIQQVQNISRTSLVQKAWEMKQPLSIHGWVYDLSTGRIEDLHCTISSAEQLSSVYLQHLQGPEDAR